MPPRHSVGSLGPTTQASIGSLASCGVLCAGGVPALALIPFMMLDMFRAPGTDMVVVNTGQNIVGDRCYEKAESDAENDQRRSSARGLSAALRG
jgi:hypothetical protein